jgi:hypothetical protein
MKARAITKTETAIVKAAYTWWKWYHSGGTDNPRSGFAQRGALDKAILADKRAKREGGKR